jgi:tetratricopeptide (TPR) repeat protein
MKISPCWPSLFLLGFVGFLFGLTGCGGTSSASTQAKTADEWIKSGNSALDRGEFDQAIDDFTHAEEAEPDSAVPLERRAAAYLKMEDYRAAVADCDSALKIDKKLASAYFVRGLAEKARGELEKASEDFSQALANGRERVDVLVQRGEINRARAKIAPNRDEVPKLLQKSMADFDRAVKIDGHLPELRVQRALVALDIGDYSKAVADCDEALKADPKAAAAHVARARAECELGENANAVHDCDSAIRLDGNSMEACVVRARAQLDPAADMRTVEEVAQCSKAVDDCKQAIELAKKVKGDLAATSDAQKVRGIAHQLRGRIYHGLQAGKKALDEYGQALALDPNLVGALLDRATTEAALGNDMAALNDCDAAINVDRARPDAYSVRGTIYFKKNDFEKALKDFTQAVQLDNNCAKAYFGRSRVYATLSLAWTGRAKASRESARKKFCLNLVEEYRKKCIADATEAIRAN